MYRYGTLWSKVSNKSLRGYARLNTGNPALHFFRHAALRRMWRTTRRLLSANRVSLSRLTELQLRLQNASLSRSSRWSRRLSSRNLMLSPHFCVPYCSSAYPYAESSGMMSLWGKLLKLYFSYWASASTGRRRTRHQPLRSIVTSAGSGSQETGWCFEWIRRLPLSSPGSAHVCLHVGCESCGELDALNSSFWTRLSK